MQGKIAGQISAFAWSTIFLFLLQVGCSSGANFKSNSFSSDSSAPNPNPGDQGPLVTPMPTPTPSGPVRQSPTPGQWVNVTRNLAGMASECGNTSYVSAKPNEDLIIASVALQGLWGSSDGGTTWRQLGTAPGSAQITHRGGNIVYDPVAPGRFWRAGIYSGNGVFRSDNSGLNFTALGNVTHVDSVSVDFSDPNRMTLLAGGHEQSQRLYRSQDGGITWSNIGGSLPAGSAFSSFPLVVNSRTFFAGCFKSFSSGTPGIFQTNDAGASWNQVSAKGGGSIPLVASDGSIYWPSDDGSLVRGVGQGANWTFTQTVGSGTLMNVQPLELPDGRIVSLSRQNIMISADRGVTWQPFGPALPFNPVGITYSNFDRSFYIWQFDCNNRVLPNAIMKLWM